MNLFMCRIYWFPPSGISPFISLSNRSSSNIHLSIHHCHSSQTEVFCPKWTLWWAQFIIQFLQWHSGISRNLVVMHYGINFIPGSSKTICLLLFPLFLSWQKPGTHCMILLWFCHHKRFQKSSLWSLVTCSLWPINYSLRSIHMEFWHLEILGRSSAVPASTLQKNLG